MRLIAFPQLGGAAWRRARNSSVDIVEHLLCLLGMQLVDKSVPIAVAQLHWPEPIDLLER